MEMKLRINLTEDQVKSIAEDLDCGFSTFYNLKTKQILALPDNQSGFELMDDLSAEWQKIESNPESYFEINKMDSGDSFSLMQDFLEKIPDAQFKARLAETLNKPKPIRNFKNAVENNGDYRQKWYTFKNQKMKDWVKEQIENYNDLNNKNNTN
jgi:hypothetical protein